MSKRFYIETVGCQMNVLDGELVTAELLRAGYELVDGPRWADAILFLTCSVRQHAEDKIYSALGRLKHVKQRQPQKIVGVLGCMAQKDQRQIFRRAPHVDLVVGPGGLHRVAGLLKRISAGEGPLLEVGQDAVTGDLVSLQEGPRRVDPPRLGNARPRPHQAMVRIMRGCNRSCSYCVVPAVRGPEQNRPVREIETEIRRLADQGCLEVTLLGQTVNGYRDTTGDGTVRLADLLYKLQDVEGIRRLKFVTNHPRHMTGELIEAVRDLSKVSPYLHVPAQSGSNEILRRMRRGYTVEAYREMLARIRQTVPDVAVTSDFIVGFPGETQTDYGQTVELLREGRFKNSFIFKYSPRPKTTAAELYRDDVPQEVKRRRNNELLAIQNAISLAENRPLLGRGVEILVEGPSKAARKRSGHQQIVQLTGRTVCDRIVVFDGPRHLIGQILPVEIEKVESHTLFGKLL